MSDLPHVVNPEAVGDPNQTPIVRLWDAHKYLTSDQRVSSQTEDVSALRAAVEEARRERDELHEEMATRWAERASVIAAFELMLAEVREQRDAATARAELAEAEVEMQRAILRRVRDLQARAEGYDFSIDPADLLAALRGTDNTGGTDGE